MFIKSFPLTFMNVAIFNNFLVTSLTFLSGVHVILYILLLQRCYIFIQRFYRYSDFIASGTHIDIIVSPFMPAALNPERLATEAADSRRGAR